MTREQYTAIFLKSHPGFFDGDEMKGLDESQVYEEMFLPLKDFSPDAVRIPLPEGVTFGMYNGDRQALLTYVREVDSGWPQWFGEKSPVFCAYLHGELASFCLLEIMGEYAIGGRTVLVGGPGCVGTRPAFRRKGIGLAMVQQATELLRQRGCDYSYIHYTGVAHWYARLGYRTELRWNRNGILP